MSLEEEREWLKGAVAVHQHPGWAMCEHCGSDVYKQEAVLCCGMKIDELDKRHRETMRIDPRLVNCKGRGEK